VRLFLNPKLSKNLSPSSGEGISNHTGFASCEMNVEFLKNEETINHRLLQELLKKSNLSVADEPIGVRS
jgi:hypothetical protein